MESAPLGWILSPSSKMAAFIALCFAGLNTAIGQEVYEVDMFRSPSLMSLSTADTTEAGFKGFILRPSSSSLLVTTQGAMSGLGLTTEGRHVKSPVDPDYRYEEHSRMLVPMASKRRISPAYRRDDGTYVVLDPSGEECILAYFETKITVYYETRQGTSESVVLSPPDEADHVGVCDRDDEVARLSILWPAGTFSLNFGYDDLTDSWYVDRFSFKYNTSAKDFVGVNKKEVVLVESEENRRFWQTSHARSFRCLLLHDIPLLDEEEKHTATVHFDKVRAQALTYGDRFKPPKHCLHRKHRDETVPMVVGFLLAVTTLSVIGGYAGFRYFKVKRFQYEQWRE